VQVVLLSTVALLSVFLENTSAFIIINSAITYRNQLVAV